ncbi:MAG: hypothetical protein A2505_08720 [Deltaproteobacteria bacterium RIFOXYD12_FULL_55_16]|nr:MAG: hypothetical protein A2505_08720 [Deltaproteobacteria bacterium RIFOXYD12_FULL_55_16]
MKANRKSGKTFFVLLLLFVLAVQATPVFAAGQDRGVMRVTFLYAIEDVGSRSELLKNPIDLAFDPQSGALYVVDPGYGAIMIYDVNGMYTGRIPLKSKEGAPMMVSSDAAGRIYVGYSNSSRISVLDYKGAPLAVLDLAGASDEKGGKAVRPLYLASGGPDGAVYAMKSRGGVVRLDPEGQTHAEIKVEGKNTEEGPNQIFGFSMDRAGRFLFSDMRPYSVVRYDSKEQNFQRIGKPGVIYGLIARPAGLATDNQGHIFVTSTVRNKVLCYDAEGEFVEEFGGLGKNYGQFYMPGKLAMNGGNRLFVLETALKRVQVFEVEFPQEGKTAG